VSNNAVGTTTSSQVYVFATNYNVLRVMSGMGGKQKKVPKYITLIVKHVNTSVPCYAAKSDSLKELLVL
jgi:hypothetical protein